ncbi:hypothetical protein [Shewanella phage FishSpeaker]|nr:hypothetical protein [Shewanella phage FishSpeaker]
MCEKTIKPVDMFYYNEHYKKVFLLNLKAFNRECLPVECYSETAKQLAKILPNSQSEIDTKQIILSVDCLLIEIHQVIDGLKDTCRFLQEYATNDITIVRCSTVGPMIKYLAKQIFEFNNQIQEEGKIEYCHSILECLRALIVQRDTLSRELNTLPFLTRVFHHKYIDVLKHSMCFGGSYK